MTDLPFRVEYAKSGRAGCKACKENIAKDSLRLASIVQVRHRTKKIFEYLKIMFNLYSKFNFAL